jgi:hypothetical protein
MARSTESSLKDMETWTDRLGHTGLRSFTGADGHLWVEQNRTKASKWAKLARKGHDIAWEFEKPGGRYTGCMLIDGAIYTPRAATNTFLKVQKPGQERQKRGRAYPTLQELSIVIQLRHSSVAETVRDIDVIHAVRCHVRRRVEVVA